MTHDKLLEKLRRECEGSSQNKVSKRLGVSCTYLNRVLHGATPIGPRLAAGLGYVKVCTFRPLRRGEG